jgi:hypothetical protein
MKTAPGSSAGGLPYTWDTEVSPAPVVIVMVAALAANWLPGVSRVALLAAAGRLRAHSHSGTIPGGDA